MSEEKEASSKTEEPTARKLEQAREKGDVIKTPDLGSMASLTGAALVVALVGAPLCGQLAYALLPFIAHPHAISIEGGEGLAVMKRLILAAAPLVIAVLAAAAVGGVGASLLQTGIMFTPDKLKFDLKKLSPLEGFKRLFGIDGLIQFAKSLIKVLATAVVAWWVLRPHLSEMTNLASMDPGAMLPLLVDVMRRMVFAVAALLLVVAGADWMIQRHRFQVRMRMTKEEVKEDFKQSEGDPHIKARQRQLRVERARRRMIQAVPNATVVVMNPTHYAVALKYEQGEDEAPVCVAKGMDRVALKIRSVAEEAGVAVIEDPALARALYAVVEVDEMIPPAHYEAVAKVIGFILNRRPGGMKKSAAHRPL